MAERAWPRALGTIQDHEVDERHGPRYLLLPSSLCLLPHPLRPLHPQQPREYPHGEGKAIQGHLRIGRSDYLLPEGIKFGDTSSSEPLGVLVKSRGCPFVSI